MKPFNNLEYQTPDTYWKVWLLYKKVQIWPLEYILDQTSLMNQGSLWPFEQSWELQKYYAVSDYF